MPAITPADLALPATTEGSREVAGRVAAARAIQAERFATSGSVATRTNAMCSAQLLDEVAAPDAEGRLLLQQAAERLALTARGYHRTLKVARTIADLDGDPLVSRRHIAEALGYRRETMDQARFAA
jgi:magnesium chelatase family protein